MLTIFEKKFTKHLLKKKFKIIKTQSITLMYFADTSQALMAQLAESARAPWLYLCDF
jgi:hypothetical protein